jgi:hypothetical protein
MLFLPFCFNGNGYVRWLFYFINSFLELSFLYAVVARRRGQGPCLRGNPPTTETEKIVVSFLGYCPDMSRNLRLHSVTNDSEGRGLVFTKEDQSSFEKFAFKNAGPFLKPSSLPHSTPEGTGPVNKVKEKKPVKPKGFVL